MSLQHLSIDQIDEQALATLATDGVCETKALEFKQDLQVATEEQKREFLSDVTALANSDGGDLVFGIRAEKGVAKELVGLRNCAPDDRIAQLENLLRDFVQPRPSGVQFKSQLLTNSSHALIIRVPRSYAAPHMVRHQGVTRFCGRNSNGKYDLDVQELRSAFLASETMSDRLKNFRLDRINKLISGGSPVVLTSNHLIVLHLLPVISAMPGRRLTTADFQELIKIARPCPIGSSGWGSSFNIDGLLVAAERDGNAYHGYVQVFRNGFLEAVDARVLRPRDEFGQIIPSIAWEKYILSSFPTYLRAMQVLSVPPPYAVSVSLLNVRGYSMYVDPQYGGTDGRPIDREHLLTDEILIESTTDSNGKLLRPLFDQVWNGCGWPQSKNYNEDGEWCSHK